MKIWEEEERANDSHTRSHPRNKRSARGSSLIRYLPFLTIYIHRPSISALCLSVSHRRPRALRRAVSRRPQKNASEDQDVTNLRVHHQERKYKSYQQSGWSQNNAGAEKRRQTSNMPAVSFPEFPRGRLCSLVSIRQISSAELSIRGSPCSRRKEP